MAGTDADTGTFLDAGAGQGDLPDKRRTRWEAWEASFLLGATLDGTDPAEIARVLRRSESAIGRELGRLLNGEITVPADSHIKTMLPKVRELLQAQGRWSPPTPKTAGAPSTAAGRVAEQYRHLVSEMTGNRALLDHIERMQAMVLAIDVATGMVTVAEIGLFCGLELSSRVATIARRLRHHRDAQASADDGPEQPPTDAGDVPAVQTGQGDFRQTWPPETKPI